MKIDFIPILPKVAILFKLATPLISEKKTIGTTNILIVFKKTFPPNSRKLITESSNFTGKPREPKNTPKTIPKMNPKKIFCVNFSFMVPSTGYAPVAESYQDPVLLLN